jgi:hypothetical protein
MGEQFVGQTRHTGAGHRGEPRGRSNANQRNQDRLDELSTRKAILAALRKQQKEKKSSTNSFSSQICYWPGDFCIYCYRGNDICQAGF